MALIKPFKGLLYSKDKISDISSVVSPPYDVLTEDDIRRYEKKNRFNVVRLIQSRNGMKGGRKIDRYKMASEYFRNWRANKVIVEDRVPSIYLYEHIFSVDQKRYRRTGFISAVKIEDFASGKVLPHENTFAGPIEDRFKLTVATRANLCSIFSIFSDPQGKVMELIEKRGNAEAIYSATDDDGGTHALFRVTETKIIEEVQAIMRDKVFLIADGHHRYETAIRYRDYIKSNIKRHISEHPSDYVMMYLTPMESSGLVVLPIYRLLKLPELVSMDSITKNSAEYFDIKKLNSREEAQKFLEENSKNNFKGFVIISENGIYLYSLRSEEIMNKFNPGNYSRTRLLLNVSVLHLLFVKHILGMSQDESERNIFYSHNLSELEEKQKEIKRSIIVLLNPPAISEIKEVAENNERMPHKSTFFYPKLLSGLVFRSLEE